MFYIFKKQKDINTTKTIDEIEASVYAALKPHEFKKHGRTLHRFVSGDISQVINFQSSLPKWGMKKSFCVNIGIRIPECTERAFNPTNDKKYYHEYECTIRSRLGTVSGGMETWYDLRKDANKISKSIIKEIEEVVIPTLDVLNSREAILAHRKDYPLFDTIFDHQILLEECMIYGHLGDLEKAKKSFDEYYQSAVDEYNNELKNGRKEYLKKGERVVFMGQDITAEKDGYVTLYGANHGHIDYLDELAVSLGLR